MEENNPNLEQNTQVMPMPNLEQNAQITPTQDLEPNTQIMPNLEQNNESINDSSNTTNTNKSKKPIVLVVAILAVIAVVVCLLITMNGNKKETKEIAAKPVLSEYAMSGNSLENFDLYFLKLENEKINKIYSPLSIKYAFEMLEEGASGTSKEQISAILGQYEARKYTNSKNMSFANAMFINEKIKDTIKSDYIENLKTKYNAEILFDSFEDVKNINSWISDKTLKLINGALDDVDPEKTFMLVNALGIDMEWENKFWKTDDGFASRIFVNYSHEHFGWSGPDKVSSIKFENKDEVSGMEIIASFNRYDIVGLLGEDKIRETVGNEFKKYLADPNNSSDIDYYLKGDHSEENVNKVVNEYLDEYIKEINKNYKAADQTTDFEFYVDDDVKVFAKDLKEYNGITLQYVGIMPTNVDLDNYVSNIDAEKINKILSNLKDLKLENFTDGVVTKISGFIPKFKFEYTLDLKNDLNKLGVTDIFDMSKSDLSNMTGQKDLFVDDVMHKANIEFTQDGIKAAAVTEIGGYGAGRLFDYIYDVPVEEIDLTFDNPYMFIIRDKSTGEVWFTGTVYEPLKWKDEPDKDLD